LTSPFLGRLPFADGFFLKYLFPFHGNFDRNGFLFLMIIFTNAGDPCNLILLLKFLKDASDQLLNQQLGGMIFYIV